MRTRIPRTPTWRRRQLLGGIAGMGAITLAGCMESLAARAQVDLPIRTVAIESDADGKFYHPTPERIESSEYSPLTRPLFIYVNHASIEHEPDLIGSFLEFFFNGQQAFAQEVGYFATTDGVRTDNDRRLHALVSDFGNTIEARELAGEIVCSGSNTVAPITRAAGEDFEERHPDVFVAVEPEGTGAGFAEFVQGNADIQSASRKILPEEAERAAEHGVEYSRFEIGWDGLAIVVHEENDWLKHLTLDELTEMWDFQSPVTHWDDVREEYPAEEIRLWGRDNASGTFDYFTDTITGEVGRIRTDYSPHTDTGSVMAGVAHNRYALGWGGVGYYIDLKEEPFGHLPTGGES